jgi:hypothetical protein
MTAAAYGLARDLPRPLPRWPCSGGRARGLLESARDHLRDLLVLLRHLCEAVLPQVVRPFPGVTLASPGNDRWRLTERLLPVVKIWSSR